MNAAMHALRVGSAVVLAAALLASHIAQARDTGQVFVSSEKDNALLVLDAKGALVGAFPLCKRPRHIQLSADRRQLLAACGDGHHIAVWDIAGRKVVDRLDVGEDPEMFDISPDGRTLYVSNEEDAALTAFDLAARKKLFQVKVGGEPEGVRVSADGRTVYVTSEVAGMVHVVDVASRKLTRSIAVGKRPRRLLLTPQELWVTNELGASVSVIRLADHTVQATIDFKPPGMRSDDVTPVGMALAPDGKTAYVALGRANHVAAVDVASRQVRGHVLVGRRAWGLGLSRDGRTLYVTNGLSDDMTLVDTASLKALKSVKAGRVPHSVVVDD